MADEMNGEREALCLSLEKRGGVWVVQFAEGGCRPASSVEVDLWQALQAGRASLAANAGSEPVHQVFMDRGWHDVPESDLWMYPTAENWQVRTLYTHPSPPEGIAGWKPIETAPKDGTTFLAWRRGRVAEAYYVPRDDCEMWGFAGRTAAVEFVPDIRPTHWQPLPAPPIPASEAKGAT